MLNEWPRLAKGAKIWVLMFFTLLSRIQVQRSRTFVTQKNDGQIIARRTYRKRTESSEKMNAKSHADASPVPLKLCHEPRPTTHVSKIQSKIKRKALAGG